MARLPVQCAPAPTSGSLPQSTIKGQNISVMQPQIFQKVSSSRPILTVNGQSLIPVQVSQGQAIILNSSGQNIIAKPKILPKGSSPDKLMSSQGSTAQVYVPLSFVNSDTKVTVRPIVPRGQNPTIRNIEQDKRKQHQQVNCVRFLEFFCILSDHSF